MILFVELSTTVLIKMVNIHYEICSLSIVLMMSLYLYDIIKIIKHIFIPYKVCSCGHTCLSQGRIQIGKHLWQCTIVNNLQNNWVEIKANKYIAKLPFRTAK